MLMDISKPKAASVFWQEYDDQCWINACIRMSRKDYNQSRGIRRCWNGERVGFQSKRGRNERARLVLRCCVDNGGYACKGNGEFVKMMREAQPYFQAHRGSTFFVIISSEISESPHLPSILEATKC